MAIELDSAREVNVSVSAIVPGESTRTPGHHRIGAARRLGARIEVSTGYGGTRISVRRPDWRESGC